MDHGAFRPDQGEEKRFVVMRVADNPNDALASFELEG